MTRGAVIDQRFLAGTEARARAQAEESRKKVDGVTRERQRSSRPEQPRCDEEEGVLPTRGLRLTWDLLSHSGERGDDRILASRASILDQWRCDGKEAFQLGADSIDEVVNLLRAADI